MNNVVLLFSFLPQCNFIYSRQIHVQYKIVCFSLCHHFQDPFRKLVYFEDLKTLYLANTAVLEYNAKSLECSNSYVDDISDILHKDRTTQDIIDANIGLQW